MTIATVSDMQWTLLCCVILSLNCLHIDCLFFCVYRVRYRFPMAELVWKVARYTSAAPVFFAECDNYVDGGVKANNPTTYGLAEIQDFLANKHG